MFAWLEEEMASVKTPKFFLVEGPASLEFRQVVETNGVLFPPSYKEFVLRFGNAKLYRCSSYWHVEVYAGPRLCNTDDGETYIQFGRTHTSLSYFKEALLVKGEESPVFEWRHEQGIRKTYNGFEEWLKAKCRAARKSYKKKEWEAIVDGPQPFTEKEKAIVEARRYFRWRVIGVAANENLRFEIHNGSKMTLPYLSVGIRGKLRPPKTGPLCGSGPLPVAQISPGETKIVEYDCYKKDVVPEDTEVFDLPDPGPEDRSQYWEFKAIN